MSTLPSAAPLARPEFRFRMRITVGDAIAIGPGKVQLLEAILETGSLTAAAKRIDMSYRRAWVLINELNTALKTPAVESGKGGGNGGGSMLTPVGLQVIEHYRAIEARAAAACAAEIRSLTALFGPDKG
ncbi:winged helix-turn-helix domain-containing protein [Variovorax boronicumulans]|uniref:winged helix-turn-helix domain-containing protein n=1 Tax=Variovorax boronicumulans TaxID=436515 RepID=UPI001C5630EC